jgi:hypothetical protein
MAKIYVAGKELNRAKKVIDILRGRGHQITYDRATEYSDIDPVKKASDELNGVRDAEVLVYLWESDQESARYEAGMAMGLGKKIVISGGPDPFFFKLPNIYHVASDEEIAKAI